MAKITRETIEDVQAQRDWTKEEIEALPIPPGEGRGRIHWRDNIGMRRTSRGGTWWVRYYVESRQVQEKAGTWPVKSFRDVKRDLASRQGDVAKGKFNTVKALKAPLFSAAAEEFEKWSLANLKAGQRYVDALKHLTPFFKGKAIDKLSGFDVERFKKARTGEKAQPGTINKELTALSSMLNHMVKWGKLRANPLAGKITKFPDIPNKLRFLEDKEIKKLLEVMDPWLVPFFRLAIHTGGRRGELLKLTWGDVDLQRGLITFQETKNGTTRHIPLNKAAREVIEGQKELKEAHPWVLYFGGDVKENWWPIRKLFWKACDDAKIERITPHTLRHTFASHCAMAGVDLRTLAELLGHKTLDMVMRYSHLSPEHKAAAVALLNDLEKGSGDVVELPRDENKFGTSSEEKGSEVYEECRTA